MNHRRVTRPNFDTALAPTSFAYYRSAAMLRDAIGRLRLIGMIEGASYIVLLGIAMPLKYFADMPHAVRVVGMAHGVLFIVFCLALVHAWAERAWPLGRVARLFVASLLPFGPFVVDRGLRDEQATTCYRSP